MVSTSTMIERLSGCIGTGDLTEWEEGFVSSLVDLKASGEVLKLSERQVETLDRLHAKHFG